MRFRVRFWIEVALAATAGLLAVLTAALRDWIEVVFGVDPDAHSGSLEWGLVVGLAGLAVCLALAARYEYGRTVASSRSS